MYNFNGRRPNTTQQGSSFSLNTIINVWNRGRIDHVIDPSGRKYRRDSCGALMKFKEYGNTDSKEGWEVDHIQPVSKGGRDDLQNLQPLQWQNNRTKSDNLQWTCKVRA